MEVLQEKVGDVKVLHLRGRLDLTAAPEFEGLVKSLMDGGETRIVLECKDLKYVSSSGLGTFISIGKQLAGGGSLVFAGLSSHLASLFEMTGLASIFSICQTKQDALTKLGVSAE